MIIEKIVGNIKDLDTAPQHIERVYVRSDDLVKKIQRVKTDHGKEIGIRLKDIKELSDGDILFQDEKNSIVISVIEDDVIVIKPTSIQQMGEIAHQLGNRHLPAQFNKDEMIVQYDYLVEKLLNEHEVPFIREKRKMNEAFKHIGHSHD
ncbi:urease accessory protein UreE [Metabacillus sediminilitoris]|uniref:Urease accessory protein UreE n=1 Tax=Metabacillus sediminilitoris TaxID=2567941 RepID=A0A4S4BYX2_9BACI|nr:urease accessory protein UreE [Metabacillus sediminilitoris]QGQ47133.1 urease accessory protein UreE [Metabacillus sediminilitoris]THF80478.1 urease accessory protein UreE [Metabacillus sediminilitoris]